MESKKRKSISAASTSATRKVTARKSGIKKWFLILSSLIGVVWMLIFFSGYIPLSSLKYETRPDLETQIKVICDGHYQVYPPTSYNWREVSFPLYSPDKRFYFEIVDSDFRQAEKIKLFRTDSSKLVGSYSYFRLFVYCWDKDSSGIYISDYDPGDSSLFIPFSRGGSIGPVKKLLVP